MGSPPPPDAPSPDVQDAASAAGALPAAPVGALLCGFALPGLPPFPSFSLPSLSFAFPPAFSLPIPPLCDLAKAISDSVSFGGGRVGRDDLENDPEG